MTNQATSNYDRIYDLGVTMAKALHLRRPSDMLDWPRTLQVWQALESRLEQRHQYDVIRAAMTDADVKVSMGQLRARLHYMGVALSARLYLIDTDLLTQHAMIVAREDQVMLIHKGKSYGDSWKRRGGIGAFMMLCRKWDRIENLIDGSSSANGPELLSLLQRNPGDVQDDVADLRRYLLLVEDEAIERATQAVMNVCGARDLTSSLRPLQDSGGEVYTLDEFRTLAHTGAISDDDGVGYLATQDTYDQLLPVTPSKVHELPTSRYTHVVWFAK